MYMYLHYIEFNEDDGAQVIPFISITTVHTWEVGDPETREPLYPEN